MSGVDLLEELRKLRIKGSKDAEELVSAAKGILNNELFSQKNILEHLKEYNKFLTVVDEEDVETELIFHKSDIKKLCIDYRLRFLESKYFKTELPYESTLKIDHHNLVHHKNIDGLKVLGSEQFFRYQKNSDQAILFAPTNHGNYYLVHCWGRKLSRSRKFANWPLRNFETLFITLLLFSLTTALIVPTKIITSDPGASYWCGLRISFFFHVLIITMGIAVYVTFAFSKNLSSSIWDSEKRFG